MTFKIFNYFLCFLKAWKKPLELLYCSFDLHQKKAFKNPSKSSGKNIILPVLSYFLTFALYISGKTNFSSLPCINILFAIFILISVYLFFSASTSFSFFNIFRIRYSGILLEEAGKKKMFSETVFRLSSSIFVRIILESRNWCRKVFCLLI